MSFRYPSDTWSLWPATIILKGGRDPEPTQSVLERVRDWLRLHRFLSDDEITLDLDRLKSPAAAADVLNWLSKVWRRMESCEQSLLLAERRAFTHEILHSSLSDEDRAALLTAVDYLFRLSAAGKTARNATEGDKVTIPATRNSQMQSAYRKLVGLAATDLPIWLAGEQGTEKGYLARMVNRLRGFRDADFHELKITEDGSLACLNEITAPTSQTTVFIQGIDCADMEIQKSLYERMVEEMQNSLPTLHMIVTSNPLDLESDRLSGVFLDLFLFLAPLRVDIPPLRSRTEDLKDLIEFLFNSRKTPNPASRFQPEVLQAFREYHWPGNTEELGRTLGYILKKRPSGTIRLQDLPESILRDEMMSDGLVLTLKEIAGHSSFRVLRSEEGVRRLARFLMKHKEVRFSAGDVQAALALGRETARRLLEALSAGGLIEGIRGAQEKRTTGYRCCFSGVVANRGIFR